MLKWANRFSVFCFLDNHQYQIEPRSYECLLAVDAKRRITADAGNALQQLQEFIDERPCWLFGHLGYDLKNEIEQLQSSNPDHLHFPDLFFFEPGIILRLTENEMFIEGADQPARIYEQVLNEPETSPAGNQGATKISSRMSREEYIEIIHQLKKHIVRGDCYEINFCQEFFERETRIDPVWTYGQLSSISPNPFSALYKVTDKYLLSASPERWLRRDGNRILSQPIKGTSSRHHGNEELDERSRKALQASEKERSENVMVVDLVRNDLSRVCREGSVEVEELFGVYSFPQVHQMISTVSGELREGISFSEIARACFPMGSMTGAPKKSVMELIEKYEKTKRGIFSGALGYFDPSGNFDFNVVIRSIMYNASAGYLSFQTGSAITFYSDPDKEYEECLLKARAMMEILNSSKQNTSSK